MQRTYVKSLRSLRRLYSSIPTVETVASVRDPNYKIPSDSIIVSGIQPTGVFHLGNYLGATRLWSDLAHRVKNDNIDAKLLFFTADLHSLTVPQDYQKLRSQRVEAFASILACGIDTKDAVIFHQSSVPEHTQLHWVLSCFSGMGYLNRMSQWKSKANLNEETTIIDNLGTVKLGLFTYPVLMASDVLLYGTTHCPVGQDQAQHLELTRDLAQTFNRTVGKDILTLPQTLLAPTNKIASFKDPSKKMSKSDSDPMAKLEITENDKSIRQKIYKSVTDSIEGKLTFDPVARPGISNLITIVSALKRKHIDETTKEIEDFTKKELKDLTADLLITELKEPREKFLELMKDPESIEKLAAVGAEEAREMAQKNLNEIYKLVGMR